MRHSPQPIVIWLVATWGTVAHGGVTYVDVTAAAGLHFENRTPFDQGGVSVADINGDLLPDLFFQNGPPGWNELYLNNGDGTFAEVGESWGIRLNRITTFGLFFDVDHDGLLDLALATREPMDVFMLRNTGSSFVDVSLASNCALPPGVHVKGSGTAFDYDLDGFLDLYYTGDQCDTGGIAFQNLRNGSFAFMAPCMYRTPYCVNWSVTSADFDLDGRCDIFVAEDFAADGSRLLHNRPDGIMYDIAPDVGITGNDPDMGVTTGDYDNDGDLDIFVTDIQGAFSGGNRLFRNELMQLGRLYFSEVGQSAGVRASGWAWGCSFFDYDNDGWLDLLSVSGKSKLWRNRGNGTFQSVGTHVGWVNTGDGKGAVTLDYDLDGDLDILQVTQLGPARLWRNDSANIGNWLKVNLEDRTGRDPFANGALIYVTCGTARQMRQLKTATSFFGQEEFVQHFGVGSAASVNELLVVWPDQTWDLLVDVPPNQLLTLRRVQGDFNSDGGVTADDVHPFVETLLGRREDQNSVRRADLNGDGVTDVFDIAGFVQQLE